MICLGFYDRFEVSSSGIKAGPNILLQMCDIFSETI